MTKQRLDTDQRDAFLAALLGWSMDAVHYFIVVFVYADIAKTFGHTKTEVAFRGICSPRSTCQSRSIWRPPTATPSR